MRSVCVEQRLWWWGDDSFYNWIYVFSYYWLYIYSIFILLFFHNIYLVYFLIGANNWLYALVHIATLCNCFCKILLICLLLFNIWPKVLFVFARDLLPSHLFQPTNIQQSIHTYLINYNFLFRKFYLFLCRNKKTPHYSGFKGDCSRLKGG